ASYGTPITLTATVTSENPSSGNVEFFDDTTGADLGAGALQGTNANTATWVYTSAPTQLGVLGSPHSIRAVFTGIGANASGSLPGGIVVTPLTLTLSNLIANSKAFDYTAKATLDTSGAFLVGLFTGDRVALDTSKATATFASSAVGTNIPVTI